MNFKLVPAAAVAAMTLTSFVSAATVDTKSATLTNGISLATFSTDSAPGFSQATFVVRDETAPSSDFSWRKTWLEFTVPTGFQSISSAQLQLFGASSTFSTSSDQVAINLYAVSDWPQDSFGWTGAPDNVVTNGHGIGTALVPVASAIFKPDAGQATVSDQWYSFNFTPAGLSLLQSDADQKMTFALAMASSTGMPSFEFNNDLFGVGPQPLKFEVTGVVPEPVCFMSLASVSLGLLLRKRQPVAR
jgi:hypothetical protein